MSVEPIGELTALQAARTALLGYCAGHSPSIDTYGATCDERGCAICNAGTVAAAQSWFDSWMDGEAALPFDLDDDAEVDRLLVLAVPVLLATLQDARLAAEELLGVANESDGIIGWHMNGDLLAWPQVDCMDKFLAVVDAIPAPEPVVPT